MRNPALGKDFRLLWLASASGTAVANGALTLVAVLVLHAPAAQVSLLVATAALASAVISLPFGARIEFRTKRPVMVAADLVRFAVLASVPLTAALHVLAMAQLYLVEVVQSAAFVAFTAAGGAHLKALVGSRDLPVATGRFESTTWASYCVGPPVGGLLVGAFGATAAMLVDGLSYLLSAAFVRRIRTPEPAPPVRTAPAHLRRDTVEGWRYVLHHPVLRLLFVNASVFGGAVLMTAPLQTVLMLRDLGFSPFEYGLVLGVSSLGAVFGAGLAARLQRRLGARRLLLITGIARTPWLLLIPFVSTGTAGVVQFCLLDTGLLLSASVFNPTFTAYRLHLTRDDMVARVGASWSVAGRAIRPLFIALGGAVTALADVRVALLVAGVLCLASAPLMPTKQAELQGVSHVQTP